jgi:hypothetical protein
MIVDRIKAMLEACEAGTAAFPPAELYNEDWLLRIILDWFSRHGGDRYPLSPLEGAHWFSQAWLPSAFMSRYRGDRLAEARTHADAVLGHFVVGDPGTAALSLSPGAQQLVVFEAKLFARLSAGVRNAPYYDQAARSVACIAEALRRAEIEPEMMKSLSFILVAPQARLDDGIFEWDLTLDAIRRKVRRRVEDYAGERDSWLLDWFEPTWRCIEIRSLSWEEIIETIAFHRPEDGHVIDSFYGQCLRFNRPRATLPRAPFPVRSRSTICSPLPDHPHHS